MRIHQIRLPRWLAACLGIACSVLGGVLIFRPFTSLSVLVAVIAIGLVLNGVTTIATPPPSGARWAPLAAGVGWIAAGIAVVAWVDITIDALAVIVGIALVAAGILDVVAGVRGSADERLASVIGGAATIVFGVLALSWPSITLLVVAVVFGARLVLFGLRTAWSAFRGDADEVPSTDRSPWRRRVHLVGTIGALLVALALAGISSRLQAGEPTVDAFYDPPDELPSEPGVLLRTEGFTRTIPANARAWRILYTTTRDDGIPAVASALVVVPDTPSDEPLPVIALAHGTTGVDRTCAPSVLDDPFAAGAFFALDGVIDRGWALVATDYVGLGTPGPHPYLIGEPTGRSVLDSVRAARQLDGVELADETVVWGHSQGGGAALWTGGLATSYAPDVGVIGVAALAPASDLVGLMENLPNVTGGTIFSTYVLDAYAAVYDDVDLDDYVRPSARPGFDAAADRCLAEPAALLSVAGALAFDTSGFRGDLTGGPLRARLDQNVPTAPIDAPLLIAQGEADSLVRPSVQAQYVADRCAAGQPIDYRTYPGRDHVPLVQPDSPLLPDLFEWTEARLDGAAPTPNCPGR